jgi:hypothetical protein
LHEHYDDFKDSDPGSIGWALDRQVFDWVVPYHDGAIQAYRALGVWSEHFEQHNNELLRRQSVLSQAWSDYLAENPDDADFRSGWLERRIVALEAAGFDPIWR